MAVGVKYNTRRCKFKNNKPKVKKSVTFQRDKSSIGTSKLMNAYKKVIRAHVSDFDIEIDLDELKSYDFDQTHDLVRKILHSGMFRGKKYPVLTLDKILKMSLRDTRYADFLTENEFPSEKVSTLSRFAKKNCSYDTVKELSKLSDYKLHSLATIFEAKYDYKKYMSDDYTDEQVMVIALAADMGIDPRRLDDIDYSKDKMVLKLHMILENANFIDLTNIHSDYLCKLLSTIFKNNLSFPELNYDDIKDNEAFMCDVCHNLKLADTDEYLRNMHLPGEELYSRLLWLVNNEDCNYRNMVRSFVNGCKNHTEYFDKFKNVNTTLSDKFKDWFLDYYEIVLLREGVRDYDSEFKKCSEYLNYERESKISDNLFTNEQLDTIEYGWSLGLPIESFAKSDYSVEFMEIIIDLLYRGFKDIPYEKFQLNQIKIIQQAAVNGVNVEVLAKPDMKYAHMKLLYQDLVSGLDIEKYANPELPFRRVKELSNKNRLQQEETIKRLGLYV